MLLQDQRHRSPQAGHASFRRPHAWGISNEGSRSDFGLNHRAQSLPLAREFTDNYNLLGGQPGDDHAHAPADGMGHLFQRSSSTRVAGFRKRKQILKTSWAWPRLGLVVVTQCGSIGGINLPATTTSAATGRPLRVHLHVSKFAGHSIQAAGQVAIDENPGADSL